MSGSNTTKLNKVTPTTSNFGIFQISTEYCGQNGKPGGKCNISCDSETRIKCYLISRLLNVNFILRTR